MTIIDDLVFRTPMQLAAAYTAEFDWDPSPRRRASAHALTTHFYLDDQYAGTANVFIDHDARDLKWITFFPLSSFPELQRNGLGTFAQKLVLDEAMRAAKMDYTVSHNGATLKRRGQLGRLELGIEDTAMRYVEVTDDYVVSRGFLL